jgi:hypothetical protein
MQCKAEEPTEYCLLSRRSSRHSIGYRCLSVDFRFRAGAGAGTELE